MTVYYQDPYVTIHLGDCREILPTLDAGSIQTCVTSPPYFGLRDYGGGQWRGGDEGCDHTMPPIPHTGLARAAERADGTHRDASGTRAAKQPQAYRDICGKCGATRHDQQIGLEQTPAAYVAEMTGVFEQVRRVLRDDGSLWLNLGDSYASQPAGNTDATFTAKQASNAGSTIRRTRSTVSEGLKPKDLIGIPWRVAFALQDAGWWLRSDIIWSKGNPMPESVTDRPTKAHEYLFLMAKAERYWYDQDAIREPIKPETASHVARYTLNLKKGVDSRRNDGDTLTYFGDANGRNRRSVWTVNTQPFPGSHFAVFPEKLIEPCILAGAPERSCAVCGAPWGRVVESDAPGVKVVSSQPKRIGHRDGWPPQSEIPHGRQRYTLGWQPSCQCGAATVPGVVLDPFGGSGTVGVVAKRFGRRAILIEQNIDYCRMAAARIEATPTPFQFDAYEPDEPEPAQPEQVALW